MSKNKEADDMSYSDQAREMLDRLKAEFGYEDDDPEEEARHQRAAEARKKRLDEAGNTDNYIKLFNRDPWTDEWLGPGPEEPMPYLEDDLKPKDKMEAMRERIAKQNEEWQKLHGSRKTEIRLTDNIIHREYKAKKKKEAKDIKKGKIITNAQVAAWVLEYLFPKEMSDRVMDTYTDYEELVKYCCDYFRSWVSWGLVRDEDCDISVAKYLKKSKKSYKPRTEYNEGGMVFRTITKKDKSDYGGICTIPKKYRKKFDKWCKKNPLSKFTKKADKRNISASDMRKMIFSKKFKMKPSKHVKNVAGYNSMNAILLMSDEEYNEYKAREGYKFNRNRDIFIKYTTEMLSRKEISEDMAISMLAKVDAADELIKKKHKKQEEIERSSRERTKLYRIHNTAGAILGEKLYRKVMKDYKKLPRDINGPIKYYEMDGFTYGVRLYTREAGGEGFTLHQYNGQMIRISNTEFHKVKNLVLPIPAHLLKKLESGKMKMPE